MIRATVKMPVETQTPCQSSQFVFSQFLSLFWLPDDGILGRNRYWPNHLSFCHSHRRSGLSPGFLALAWHTPGHRGHLGSEPSDKRALYNCLYVSLLLFLSLPSNKVNE